MARAIEKVRLDQLMVAQGLADNRTRAAASIMAGRVRIDGQVVTKAGVRYPADTVLTCDSPPPYVSRGGFKLAGALDTFGLDVTGLKALDAGASTGGFTDCLLQRGAAHVVAADVGYGQLDSRLANDQRVTVMDRTNVRHLTPGDMPHPMQLIVGDLSFISLTCVLPALQSLLADAGHMVLLVKPQFEVGRARVGKGGIVRDEAARQDAIQQVTSAAEAEGLTLLEMTTSSITGAKGNVEYLIHLVRADPAQAGDPVNTS